MVPCSPRPRCPPPRPCGCCALPGPPMSGSPVGAIATSAVATGFPAPRCLRRTGMCLCWERSTPIREMPRMSAHKHASHVHPSLAHATAPRHTSTRRWLSGGCRRSGQSPGEVQSSAKALKGGDCLTCCVCGQARLLPDGASCIVAEPWLLAYPWPS